MKRTYFWGCYKNPYRRAFGLDFIFEGFFSFKLDFWRYTITYNIHKPSWVIERERLDDTKKELKQTQQQLQQTQNLIYYRYWNY